MKNTYSIAFGIAVLCFGVPALQAADMPRLPDIQDLAARKIYGLIEKSRKGELATYELVEQKEVREKVKELQKQDEEAKKAARKAGKKHNRLQVRIIRENLEENKADELKQEYEAKAKEAADKEAKKKKSRDQ